MEIHPVGTGDSLYQSELEKPPAAHLTLGEIVKRTVHSCAENPGQMSMFSPHTVRMLTGVRWDRAHLVAVRG